MRVVILGGAGFLGHALVRHLEPFGYECTVLTRDPQKAAARALFPPSVQLASNRELPAADVVVNLAGESVVGLWTERKKRAILASRVEGTQRLVAQLRTAKVRPHTLLSASAVGIYGHRPGELLEETSPADPQQSFRSRVCAAWEDAANAADALGVRVMNLRIGNVLDFSGGFLGGLLPIFRPLGPLVLADPEAAIPWISLADGVALISFAMANERWYGPLNVVAPQATTHRELARRLAQSLGRPFRGSLPPRLVRLALGEFASALQDDQRVMPAKALSAGFCFTHPTLATWLASLPSAKMRCPREKLGCQ